MLSGELYLASDPELVAAHRSARLLVERFNATSVTEREERDAVLRDLLGELGESTEIKPPFQCDYGFTIRVGARSFVNYGATILDCAPVTIGDEVQIANDVTLLTATHPLEAGPRRQGWESAIAIGAADSHPWRRSRSPTGRGWAAA